MANDKLNVFILLDRSGSMATKWNETVSSVNQYVKELNTDGYVTVAAFDDHAGPQFDILRDEVKFKNFDPINAKELQPRGGTPLFDSLEKLVDLAEKENASKTVIVVMTDGEENSSKKITKETAAYIVSRCKKRDWQVVFLGADFDAFSQAASVGVASAQTINMTAGNYGVTNSLLATKTMNYAATGVTMDWCEADRAVASGAKNKV